MSSSLTQSKNISDIGWLLSRTRWTVGYLAAFILPGILFSLIEVPPQIVIAAACVERLLQLSVIGAIFIDAGRYLSPPRLLKFTPRFFIVGFLIEIAISAGALLMVALPGLWSAATAVGMMFLGRELLQRILYPMPFLDPLLTDREALIASKAVSAQVSLSAIGMWPLAFLVLATGLTYCVYPDGRLWWSAPLAHALTGLAHLIFVFRCAAAALLATGMAVKSQMRQRLGSPTILLCSGLLLWAANFVRAYTLPPGPEVRLVAVHAERGSLNLELNATDPQYHFVGFTPQRFFIGGANSYPVSGSPQSIEEAPAGSDQTSKIYKISLPTDRTPEDLANIEDLHLWYGAVRLFPVHVSVTHAEMNLPEVAHPPGQNPGVQSSAAPALSN